jgi:nitrogen fixation protein FixH
MQHHQQARSGWRFFPLAVAGGIGLTVAVNGAMAWQAITTFPGRTGRDTFELSNRYNAVLARAEEQAALGWVVKAALNPKARPQLILTDATGRGLQGARIVATAERPLGATHTTRLSFIDQGQGRYLADMPLTIAGQWDVAIEAQADGKTYAVTRRVHVP